MTSFGKNHKRFISGILTQVLVRLSEIETIVQTGVPWTSTPTLSSAEAANLFEFVSAMRKAIEAMAVDLELSRDQAEIPVRWQVITRLQFLLVDLAELTPSNLAGYGSFDKRMFRGLRRHVQSLETRTREQIKQLT